MKISRNVHQRKWLDYAIFTFYPIPDFLINRSFGKDKFSTFAGVGRKKLIESG